MPQRTFEKRRLSQNISHAAICACHQADSQDIGKQLFQIHNAEGLLYACLLYQK